MKEKAISGVYLSCEVIATPNPPSLTTKMAPIVLTTVSFANKPKEEAHPRREPHIGEPPFQAKPCLYRHYTHHLIWSSHTQGHERLHLSIIST